MRSNSIALGEKSFEGNYNRIMSAGEIHITNSDVKRLYAAGEIKVTNTKIKKTRVAGEINVHESNFVNAKIAGELNMTGVCKADTLSITGVINADVLECKILKNGKLKESDCNGNIEWKGYFKAETFEIIHDFSLSFEYSFKNIISSINLKSQNEITCENFYGFHGVIAPGINAENIFLLVSENISVESLSGTRIIIKNKFIPDKLFKSLPKVNNYKQVNGRTTIMNIPIIEGDTIVVEYLKADCITGNDIIIGDLCVIDKVEYRNSIKISDKSVVNEVVKL